MKLAFANSDKSLIERANSAIFLVYIIFLPFTFFDLSLGGYKAYSYPIDLFVSAAGIILTLATIISCNRYSLAKALIPFFVGVLFSICASIFFATLQQRFFSGWFRTSPVFSTLKISFHVFRECLVFAYCYINCRITSFKKMSKAMFLSLSLCAVVAMMQLLVETKTGISDWAVKLVSKTGLLRGLNYITDTVNYRLPFTAPEPAWAGEVIFCYLLPMCWVLGKKAGTVKRIVLCVYAALYLLVGFYTKSTEAYLIFGLQCVILLFIFSYLLVKKREWVTFSLVMTSCCLIAFILFQSPVFRTTVIDKLRFTQDNYSTARRLSTPWSEFVVFVKHPLFGVGFSNQGYYYFENTIDKWFMVSLETRETVTGINGLEAVGPSIPFFLSSLGVVGFGTIAIPLFKLFKPSVSYYKRSEKVAVYLSLFGYFVCFCFVSNVLINHIFPFVLFLGYSLSPVYMFEKKI